MVYKLIVCAFAISLLSCTNGQKQSVVEKGMPVVSFSAQNQLDQTDNSMGWIDNEGIVPYDVHWGWRCSEQGDKSFVWFSQKKIEKVENYKLNVSENYCE